MGTLTRKPGLAAVAFLWFRHLVVYPALYLLVVGLILAAAVLRVPPSPP